MMPGQMRPKVAPDGAGADHHDLLHGNLVMMTRWGGLAYLVCWVSLVCFVCLVVNHQGVLKDFRKALVILSFEIRLTK